MGIAKFGDGRFAGRRVRSCCSTTTPRHRRRWPNPAASMAAAFIAKDGVSQAALVANMQTLVGDEASRVITGAQLDEGRPGHIHDDIASFGMFMMVFAGIAMFVGAFIINNTFSIIVSQRTKEMAMLRAIGASGRQVRRAVLIEAAAVGVVASAVGLLAGIGVAKALQIVAGGPSVSTSRSVRRSSRRAPSSSRWSSVCW